MKPLAPNQYSNSKVSTANPSGYWNLKVITDNLGQNHLFLPSAKYVFVIIYSGHLLNEGLLPKGLGGNREAKTIRPPPPRGEGVLDLAYLALGHPKSLLAGVRVTRRGNQLHLLFSTFFSTENFLSKILPKASPRASPGSPKSSKNPVFRRK